MIDSNVIEGVLSSPAFLGTAALMIIFYTIRVYLNNSSDSTKSMPVAPLVPGSATASITNAKEKYPNSPFILPLVEKWVILPNKFVNEVKNLPEDKISFQKLGYIRMQGRYTRFFDDVHQPGINALKIDLTRNIASVIADLQNEVQYIYDGRIGDCPDWKELKVTRTMLQIVSGLSARTFVGLPLCRDQEWIDSTINVVTDTMQAIKALGPYKPWQREFVAPFLPEIKRLKEYEKYFVEQVDPKVKVFVAAYTDSQKKKVGAAEEESLLQWTIQNFPDPTNASAKAIGMWQITAAFAAIHTTSMALSHCMFDLAAHPEVVKELRQELYAVIAEENYPDRLLRKTSMPKLKKLDSFIKEVQRLCPPSLIKVTRLVTAKNGITLSDGTHLPKDTIFGFFAPAGHNALEIPESMSKQPAGMPPLSEFYAWRYSDIRSVSGEENKHQFVSLDIDNLNFGMGNHACPGRFFASNEIKVVITEMIKRYEIAMGPHGEIAGQGGYERPKLLENDVFFAPDPRVSFYLKDIQKEDAYPGTH